MKKKKIDKMREKVFEGKKKSLNLSDLTYIKMIIKNDQR